MRRVKFAPTAARKAEFRSSSVLFSEAHYQTLVELLPQIVWMTNSDGTYTTFCNRYWYEYSGMLPEEISNTGWLAVLHPGDRERTRKIWLEAVATGTAFTIEYRLRRASTGEFRWHLGKGLPVLDENDKVVNWMGIALDIHDSKQAELELAEKSEGLALALETANLGIFEDLLDGGRNRASERTKEILGLSPDADFTWEGFLLLVHPDDRSRVSECIKAATDPKRRQDYEITYRIIRPDGRLLWISARGKTFFSGTGSERKAVKFIGTLMDITESKVLEDALRNSEARLSAILEAEPECIKLIAPDDTVEYINPAGLAMIQADSLEQVQGRCLRDLLDPQYRAGFEELTRKTFLGAPGGFVFEVTGLKGRRRWLETHAVPLFNTKGNVSHVLAVTRDITETKMAEQALQAREARFRALIENSSDGIVLLSKEFQVSYMSPSVGRILGYRPDEMEQQRALDFIHPDDVTATEAALRQIVDDPGKDSHVTARIRHKNGTWRFLEGTVTNLLHDPNVQAIVGNYRDVTDRVRAAEALQQSERRFEAAFRSSPLAISISTLAEDRFVDVNDAFLQMMEYAREEVVGCTAQEVGFYEKPAAREFMKRQLTGTGHVSGLQTTFRTRTGKIREIELSARLIELDEAPCILAITRDVTEAKSLEQQLQQARRMEAVGRLAGGVAHDFNNLLMIINGCTHLIKDAVRENQEVANLAEQILSAGRSAASVTKQLLAFSRKQPQTPQVFDLNEVVAQFCKMLPQFIGEDIEMIVAPTAEAGLIHADPGQIEQVIMNLVVNARDAMPRGGRLTVETNNVEVTANYSLPHDDDVLPGKYVVLIVSDTGTGIDAETQKRIFEPFFTTKEHGKGVGLGLATVYGIVKQTRGFLSVYSEVGRGATFKIFFPRAEGDRKAGHRPSAIESAAGGSETVLVVEDQDAVRKIVTDYLSSRGYRVLEANHGAVALQICCAHKDPIHILLSDIVMPGMTGPEFVRAALEVHPEAQVIFMSGYSDLDVNTLDLKVKAALLQKPMELHTLLQTIRLLLDQRQQ